MTSFFRLLKQWWMTFAHALGWLNTRILLTLAYILVIGIPAFIFFIIRKDPLRRSFTKENSYWIEKEPVEHTNEHARRQF